MRHDTRLGRFGTVIGLSAGFTVLYVFSLLFLIMRVVSNMPPGEEPTTLSGSHFKWVDSEATPWSTPKWAMVGLVVDQMNHLPWYFIREREGDHYMAYFVAYSNQTCTPMFYIGARGQSNTLPPTEQRFQIPTESDTLMTGEGYSLSNGSNRRGVFHVRGDIFLHTQDGLERVDLKAMKVTKIISAPDLQGMQFVQLTPSSVRPVITRGIVRSATTIFLLGESRIVQQYLIPPDLQKQSFSVALSGQDTISYIVTSRPAGAAVNAPLPVLKCDVSGKILSTTETPRPTSDRIQLFSYLAGAVILPGPIQLVGTLGLAPPVTGVSRVALIGAVWPSIVLQLAIGLLSTLAAWKLAPRFSGAPAGWGWLVYSFLLGIPGAVGYLLHTRTRRRPTLEPAAKLGTEVFA